MGQHQKNRRILPAVSAGSQIFVAPARARFAAVSLGLVALAWPTLAQMPAPHTTWPDLATNAAPTGGGEHDAAVIVGIEHYEHQPAIPGARANSEAWRAWLADTRGTPTANVFLVPEAKARRGVILDKVKQLAALADGGTLWIVLIGHGVRKDHDPAFVGVNTPDDGADNLDFTVTQSEILAIAKQGKQKRTMFIADSCFSGRDYGRKPKAVALPFTDHSQLLPPPPDVVRLTAGGADQEAHLLDGANRPAFSYLLLGALRGWADGVADGKRDKVVTVQEAMRYTQQILARTNDATTPEASPDDKTTLGIALARGAEVGPDLDALFPRTVAPAPAQADNGCAKDAPAACAKCARDDAAACVEFGDRLVDAMEVDYDWREAVSLWRKACYRGHAEGCWRLIDRVTYFGTAKDNNEEYRALLWPAAEKECGHGELRACEIWADLIYAKGEERVKAAQIRQKACNNGSYKACYDLAQMYDSSYMGLNLDDAKAVEMAQRSLDLAVGRCHLGFAAACSSAAGNFVLTRDKSEKAEKLRRQMLDKACELDGDQCCDQLGHADRCRAYHETQCRRGRPIACAAVGSLLADRKNKLGDPLVAAGHFEAACNSGVPSACRQLGQMYAEGKSIGQDVAQAARWQHRYAVIMKNRCDPEHGNNCRCLADAYQNGVGDMHRLDLAAAQHDALCRAEEPSPANCITAGDLRAELGAKKEASASYAEAAGLLRKSCDTGADGDCGRLLDLLENVKRGGEPRSPAVMKFLTAKCVTGREDPDACFELGYRLQESIKVGKRTLPMFRDAIEAMVAKCMANRHAPACEWAANHYFNGIGVRRDVKMACRLDEYRCPSPDGQVKIRLRGGGTWEDGEMKANGCVD